MSRRTDPELGCVGKTGRTFLLLHNMCFIVVGILVTVAGVLLKTQDFVLNTVFNVLLNGVKTATSGSGLTGIDLSVLDLGGIIDHAAVGCIAIGITVCVVAAFGLFGVKANNRTALLTYALFIGVLVVLELAFLVVLFTLRNKVDESLKAPLKTLIGMQYAGLNGSDVVSVTFNFIMIKLNCCGVDGFGDFYKASKWPTSIPINSSVSIPVLTPIACCKSEFRTTSNYACAVNPTNLNSNYRRGCYGSIWEEVYRHNTLTIACSAGVGSFELLLIFFACWVAHEIRLQKKKKRRRLIQRTTGLHADIRRPPGGAMETPLSVLSSNRASSGGSDISIRRDSNGSIHIIPDPLKRLSNTLSSLVEPPPYSPSPHLWSCTPRPAGSSFVCPRTPCFSGCSPKMFHSRSECLCQNPQSFYSSLSDMNNQISCCHGDTQRRSGVCVCQSNMSDVSNQSAIGSNNVNPSSCVGSRRNSSENLRGMDESKAVNTSHVDEDDPYWHQQNAGNDTSGHHHCNRTAINPHTYLLGLDDDCRSQVALGSPRNSVGDISNSQSRSAREAQRKRSLFCRRSLNGHDSTPHPTLRMRSRSFEE